MTMEQIRYVLHMRDFLLDFSKNVIFSVYVDKKMFMEILDSENFWEADLRQKTKNVWSYFDTKFAIVFCLGWPYNPTPVIDLPANQLCW